MPRRTVFVVLLLVAPACAGTARTRFPADAPVYRFVPSSGWPYGPKGVHSAALPASEFVARRAAFLEEIGKSGPGTVAIARSASEERRNGDVEHEYRQDSDFYWLTGWPEEGATAIFEPEARKPEVPSEGFVDSPTAAAPVYTLIVQPKAPAQETWTGKRVGPQRAVSEFGADRATANTRERTEGLVKAAIARAKTLVLVNALDEEFERFVDETVRSLKENGGGPEKVVDGHRWIAERRCVKSPAEVEMLRRAVEVSIEGHLAAMRASRPGMNEGEIEAAAEFAFRALGAPRLGYPSICGAGNQSCILHYSSNHEFAGENDLMLMDAAAEVGFYTADVTRTWPLSGKFTPEQRAIYDVVLRAQEAAIAKVKPGVPFGDIHDTAALEVTKGLVEIGLLRGDPAELVRDRAHRKFFMHGTSHWLGLDVHDTGGGRGRARPLEPGMVFTVEPGIYIPEGTGGVDPKWWRIGVRIEYDILVTETGHENLSGRLPRDPETLESIVREGQAAGG